MPQTPLHHQSFVNFPLPIIIMDGALKILFANAGAESLTGLSERQLKRNHLTKYVENTSGLEDIEARLEATQKITLYDAEITTVSREKPLYNLFISRFSAHEILVVFSPLGRRFDLETARKIQATRRSISSMAELLAHEIRNPLSGIKGAAQLLEVDVDASGHALLEMIHEEIDRIGRLVENFEGFSTIEALDQLPVNIHQILYKSRLLAEAGFGKHVKFIEDYDPSLPEVSANEDRLFQAILNLVKNAAEASDARDAEITLMTRYRHDKRKLLAQSEEGEDVPSYRALPIEIRIIDNGRGIPSDLLGSIFDPFVSTKSEGSGLGLSLVSQVISELGGTIEVSSEPRRTEFRISLPIAYEGAA